MCRTFSAICLPTEELIFPAEYTDSHLHIIESRNLPDNGRDLVKLECYPRVGGRFGDLSNYVFQVFQVDQPSCPNWWTGSIAERARDKMMNRIRRMIVQDTRQRLLGGCWILAGEAVVRSVSNTRIIAMYDSAAVEHMYGSATVEHIYDSATVERMYHSATVRHMHDSATVELMRDSATVERMYNSATVKHMYDSAAVEHMYGSATVERIYDSATVERMYHSATVKHMHDSATVKYMFDSATAPRKPRP